MHIRFIINILLLNFTIKIFHYENIFLMLLGVFCGVVKRPNPKNIELAWKCTKVHGSRRIIPFEELAKMVGFIWCFMECIALTYLFLSLKSLKKSLPKSNNGYSKFDIFYISISCWRGCCSLSCLDGFMRFVLIMAVLISGWYQCYHPNEEVHDKSSLTETSNGCGCLASRKSDHPKNWNSRQTCQNVQDYRRLYYVLWI